MRGSQTQIWDHPRYIPARLPYKNHDFFPLAIWAIAQICGCAVKTWLLTFITRHPNIGQVQT
jgi:hypothetical protein